MIADSRQVNLHPPQETLQQFVAGELSAGLNVVLSAHIEHCAACQQASNALEQSLATNWADPDAAGVASSADSIHISSAVLDRIVAQPQATSVAGQDNPPSAMLVADKSMSVPRVLARIAAAGLAWKHSQGGISQASVKLDDNTKCEFIYMAPGSKAPAHTHRGNEVMLVLDGTFSDELGEYKAADFVMRDPSHRHQPSSREGCLCFSVLDGPLVFTEGLWRLLNPLNRLMFLQSKLFG